MNRALTLIALVTILVSVGGHAGTTGILEGYVKDKNTREPIPGANVLLAQIQHGAGTDARGHFELQNIRAGSYEVRFTHVGYTTFVLKNVIINPDLRTRITVELEPSDLEFGEIIVI